MQVESITKVQRLDGTAGKAACLISKTRYMSLRGRRPPEGTPLRDGVSEASAGRAQSKGPRRLRSVPVASNLPFMSGLLRAAALATTYISCNLDTSGLAIV